MIREGTSIQQKLMRVILIICATALLLTSSAYFGYQYFNLKQNYLKQLSNTGKIIAFNSSAALAFDNAADAEEILSSLKVDEHIISAALYNQAGELFARYPSGVQASSLPTKPQAEGYSINNSTFEGFQIVTEGDKQLGTLYLRTDNSAMYELFTFYTLASIGILAFSLLVAYFMSRKLQQSISKPILALAEVSKSVSTFKDYSVRATRRTNDEIGFLTDAFNQMLSQIESQNQEIISFNQQLEEKIGERTIELEKANKELEAFSYSVSHDLRSPLRALNAYSKMFEEDYAETLDADAKKLLENIQRNAKRMGVLIDDLLEFSKLGRKEIVRTNIEMNVLVKESLKEVVDGRETNASITIEDLPPCLADRALLYQVWINLISNAVKYSSKKQSPEIHIGTTLLNDQMVYYIKDNGAGFNMDYAKMLFKVFQRLHSPQEFEGTGIGLAIIARIIAKHGGSIWAEGEVDNGATFFFSIPNNK